MVRVTLGLILLGGWSASVVRAEEAKALPTLMIKGDVVSLDSSDAAAPLLKVKDRYGFETPIYLMATTKITQGDAVAQASALTSGAAVEVEYNFDVNTAKRHAVTVKLTVPTPAATAAPVEAPAATAAPVEAPVAAPAVAPASSGEQAPSEPAAAALQSKSAPAAPGQ